MKKLHKQSAHQGLNNSLENLQAMSEDQLSHKLNVPYELGAVIKSLIKALNPRHPTMLEAVKKYDQRLSQIG